MTNVPRAELRNMDGEDAELIQFEEAEEGFGTSLARRKFACGPAPSRKPLSFKNDGHSNKLHRRLEELAVSFFLPFSFFFLFLSPPNVLHLFFSLLSLPRGRES